MRLLLKLTPKLDLEFSKKGKRRIGFSLTNVSYNQLHERKQIKFYNLVGMWSCDHSDSSSFAFCICNFIQRPKSVASKEK